MTNHTGGDPHTIQESWQKSAANLGTPTMEHIYCSIFLSRTEPKTVRTKCNKITKPYCALSCSTRKRTKRESEEREVPQHISDLLMVKQWKIAILFCKVESFSCRSCIDKHDSHRNTDIRYLRGLAAALKYHRAKSCSFF